MSNNNNGPKNFDEFMEILNRVGIRRIVVVDDARTVSHEDIVGMFDELESERNESS
ncbi:hypothetical protein [Pseudobutyrivibrio sp. MD2005]|uniref:hypothetical protein n=1 Tax=Pseudobutyrivibrio sp. MD2005 TaxID=1410616 RepID=UPI000A4CED8D|nr:hypothetical protein [Pseudobutyrivibrio sp. MD2005]